MRERQKSKVRGKARDAFSNPLARLGAGTPNLLDGTVYSVQRLTRDFMTLNALYRESWIVRRIVDTIPADMLKNWITYTSGIEPEQIKKLDRVLRRTQLIEKLKRGLMWGRLYGGALGVMLIRHQGDNLEEPLNIDAIMPDDFKGLLIFDRWNGVNPSSELVDEIGDDEYGLPKYYTVSDPDSGAAVRVHYSRCIRFIGNLLPYWEELAEMQWGASVIEAVFDELKKRDNVSWNIAQLTFMANIRVLKMHDLGQLLSTSDEQSRRELYSTLQAQNWLLSNMGAQILDAEDGMESHQYTFGGLAECYQQFIMDIAGAAEIPVTKLFGRSPSGMNATGESDLQNYYDMVGEKQESILRPILNKLLPIVCVSVFGAVPEDFDFEFEPVAEPSDEERTELAKSGTDNVVAAFNAGLISQRTALMEMKQQSNRTGIWTNITDEDIEKADAEVQQEGDMPGMPGMPGVDNTTPDNNIDKMPVKTHATDADFNEADHERKPNGQFAPKGGGGSKNDLQKPEKNGNITSRWTFNSVSSKNFQGLEIQYKKRAYSVAPGQEVKARNFAGKGASVKLRVAANLAKEYGGKPEDWSHEAVVLEMLDSNGKRVGKADVHYFYDGFEVVKPKIKKFLMPKGGKKK